MSFVVALAADGHKILRTFVPYSLVRSVVNLEVRAGATVLAEPVRTVERSLPALLPSVGAEVLPVLTLTLLLRFPLSRSGPRFERSSDLANTATATSSRISFGGMSR